MTKAKPTPAPDAKPAPEAPPVTVQTDPPAANAVAVEREESPLSFRAKDLQSACESLFNQATAAIKTNDQQGFHKAQEWLVEAGRALRKAATQCEEAEAAAALGKV